MGNGTTTDSSTPIQVTGLSGLAAIAGGAYDSLALKSDGTVWAWGDNTFGQLGNGTTASSSTPVQVSSLSGVVAIAGGTFHGLALKSDGTVWAWGYNVYGALGNGTTVDSSTPVQVSSLSGVVSIAGGGQHSLALAISASTTGTLDHFAVTSSTTTPTAGNAFSVTVTAQDASNNILTTYLGTIHFSLSSSDTGATLPADYTFVGGDSGTHTFTNGVTLTVGGAQTINVIDTVQTSKTGSANVNTFGNADLQVTVSGPTNALTNAVTV